ncbi:MULTISPECIES: tetratricopeptide repeat protein [unclassified Massilia]|uniref:tetratricopeptide repeat protein n=1 Tax=unclassified Massilia TaxID=2609279 RepID=UPI0017857B60|nr:MULTISPECIES: tetratricopeptide repeat protein [unclassified Massilia]MBD8532504.1 sel1 repeat family protein [Massilia sp. CFBP 13647]MBD8675874.1 sel1 repeat family protein [Massilia sp. CFBP 13721]
MKKFTVAILLALGLSCGLHGTALAGFPEGASAYNARNYALAMKEIAPLARAGNPDAQHLLGLMYYMGRGTARDYKQAFQWHLKAAQQGKADAQYVVGAMYYTGNAVPQDQKHAVTWFRKAAEQGHGEAQHALGLMYRYHVAGVPGDPVIAYMLWNLAAAGGNNNAVSQRASIAKTMTQEQIEEAQALSRTWKVGTPLPAQSRTGGG